MYSILKTRQAWSISGTYGTVCDDCQATVGTSTARDPQGTAGRSRRKVPTAQAFGSGTARCSHTSTLKLFAGPRLSCCLRHLVAKMHLRGADLPDGGLPIC